MHAAAVCSLPLESSPVSSYDHNEQPPRGDQRMNRLGIEIISVFGLPPVEFVNLAADLGCRYISTGLQPIDYNPHKYPRFSLREDKALRRNMVAAMRERDVSISLGEGFTIRPRFHASVQR